MQARLLVDEAFAARGQQTVDNEPSRSRTLSHGTSPASAARASRKVCRPRSAQSWVAAQQSPKRRGDFTAKEGELDLDHVGIVGGGLVAVGEEAQWAALTVLVQDVNRVLPGIELGGVAFAQMEHLTLDDALAADAQAFADRIAGVRLAVLGAGAPFEKHAGSLPPVGVRPARGQVGPRRFRDGASCHSITCA